MVLLGLKHNIALSMGDGLPHCHSSCKDSSLETASEGNEDAVDRSWALVPGCLLSPWDLLVAGPSTTGLVDS